MAKTLTANQMIGEMGEAAVRLRFLGMGFQFDSRSRLEAGIDGIAEVMDDGKPLARMIAVQIKTTASGKYPSETDAGFTYLLRSEDLEYWRPSNLPIIVVLYRQSDETFYWQDVSGGVGEGERRLVFDKEKDVLDRSAVDRLAALTVPKVGFGYYVPPLGDGEEAVVNILPLTLPDEIFVASTPHTPKRAASILLDGDAPARFDWVIKDGTFWSFADPRETGCRHIVDLDQVEAIETAHLAFHEDIDERNNFAYLLRKALDHQVRSDLGWNKDRKLFYFKAEAADQSRKYSYEASKKKTDSDVVNVARSKVDKSQVDFVRHHAFVPRFESFYDQWYLVINPTYYFTTNGFMPHSHPSALLAGKKRMDNSASLRGQVILWHRFLTKDQVYDAGLFSGEASKEPRLKFGAPPVVTLATKVPEDVWGSGKKTTDFDSDQESLKLG